jgi:hypothetical protein
MQKEDLVQVTLEYPDLDFPIRLPFIQMNQLTSELLLSEIERVLQSNEQFVITFVTVCTEVDTTQERSHAGNHIVVVFVIVQVDLLIGCGSMVNDSVEMLSRYHMYLISY